MLSHSHQNENEIQNVIQQSNTTMNEIPFIVQQSSYSTITVSPNLPIKYDSSQYYQQQVTHENTIIRSFKFEVHISVSTTIR